MIIGFIPARGGSKGIINKNLQKVAGKTLIQRSVECAVNAGVNKIYVSTDSDDIAREATKVGALVIKRPIDISGDSATTESSVEHFLEIQNLSSNDVIVLLQATSPFTNSSDLKEAISRNEISGKNIFAAVKTDMFQWKEVDKKWLEMSHDRYNRKTRQDFGTLVLETGNFYIFTVRNFETFNSRFSDNVEPYQVELNSIHQIDTPEDLALAQSFENIKKLKDIKVFNQDSMR